MNLYEISTELRKTYEKLENGEGINLETGEIDSEVQQALALTQQNLQTKAIDIGYVIKSFDDEIEIYEREIKRLTEIKDQMKKRKEWLKTNLSNAMQEFGIVELKGKTIKLSFRKSESVEVTDIDALDDKFKRVKIEPDKTAIKTELKMGHNVEGARLVENQNLQIK